MRTAFLDKIIERLDRINPENLQAHFLRLATEKGLLETIFQTLQEGILVVNPEGQITYANQATERLLGLPRESVIGRPVARYLRGIDWKRILNFDAAEWSKMVTYEIEVTYPERRFISFYVMPLSASGHQEQGVLILFRDVTRDRRQEASAVESERINAVKLLAAGVAHEIGNPLNALNIHLQLVDREAQRLPPAPRETIRGLLKTAREEVSRLDLIITQFLKAIRPSPPHRIPSRIEDIVRETLELLESDIGNRRIAVHVDAVGTLPRIPVDAPQIKQAFFNVIKNALQAMGDGGRLTIGLSATDRFVVVAFRDTGCGIDPSNLGRIFEPYYTTKTSGSGLGLMVVQRIIQDHGGAIEVHSEPGTGTTVTILLPLTERAVRLLKSRSPGEETPP